MWLEEGVRSQESGVRREDEGRVELSRREVRGKKKGGRRLGAGAFLLVVHCLAMFVTRTVGASCSRAWYSFLRSQESGGKKKKRLVLIIHYSLFIIYPIPYPRLMGFFMEV
ncbi:MAG: hypothetical protein F6K23_07755 [Okeania sp. SIO2C9]|uniref:hypothetical protein n=1 Tax=Okeania sp. SIO2C9 TaxID=2607791 RepID=UPI0013C11511|nr:hypothetical protein [Okeania sp. SIO2C9]NEQ72976.1 hypothetical protein [Okeania sp. SIO2C9]